MVGDPELERHSAPARGADTPVCDGCYPCSHHRASCAGLRGSTGAPARTEPADGAAPRLHRRSGPAGGGRRPIDPADRLGVGRRLLLGAYRSRLARRGSPARWSLYRTIAVKGTGVSVCVDLGSRLYVTNKRVTSTLTP